MQILSIPKMGARQKKTPAAFDSAGVSPFPATPTQKGGANHATTVYSSPGGLSMSLSSSLSRPHPLLCDSPIQLVVSLPGIGRRHAQLVLPTARFGGCLCSFVGGQASSRSWRVGFGSVFCVCMLLSLLSAHRLYDGTTGTYRGKAPRWGHCALRWLLRS